MANWKESMQQSFEFYEVDPATWRDIRKLDNITSCTVNRDADSETLGSASIDLTNALGECYVREYLVTIQNGVKEKHPLGTHLIQTPATSFNGLYRTVSVDAYTPLLELKESPPPLGYSVLKDEQGSPNSTNIMRRAFMLTREHCRAPVVEPKSDKTLSYDFVSNTDDTWLTFISDLMRNANYTFELDELGKIMFAPIQDLDKMSPVWTFDDGNSSILYPDISINHDLYGIPNVVEVVYSNGRDTYYSRVVNDNVNSPTSTVNRGREIIFRDTAPSFYGVPDQAQVDAYARNVLESASTVEYTVTFQHAYCGVKLGDCVRLNYTRAGLTNVKARIVNQSISLVPGCPVSATATYKKKLWEG